MNRIDTEYFEELRRYKLDRQLFRFASARQVQTLIAERGHVLETGVLVAPGAEHRARLDAAAPHLRRADAPPRTIAVRMC